MSSKDPTEPKVKYKILGPIPPNLSNKDPDETLFRFFGGGKKPKKPTKKKPLKPHWAVKSKGKGKSGGGGDS